MRMKTRAVHLLWGILLPTITDAQTIAQTFDVSNPRACSAPFAGLEPGAPTAGRASRLTFSRVTPLTAESRKFATANVSIINAVAPRN
jgi:hypothetical protein